MSPDGKRGASSPWGARPAARFLSSAFLLVGASAVAYLLWFWRDQSRPGTRNYVRGMAAMEAGDPLSAEREWLRGAQEDPTDYRCYKQLGDYYAQLGRFLAARDCYATAVRLAPKKWILFVRLAAAEEKLGHLEAARTAARRAYTLRPDHADAVGLYGLLLAESRDRPAALAMLRRAHALRPADRSYFIALVKTELESLDFAGVERDLEPCLRSHPRDPEACFMMAEVYNHKPRTASNLKTAIDLAQRALAGMPRDAGVYALLGQLYLDAGQTRDALRICTAGSRAAPHSEGILRSLMECYTRLGRTAEASSVAQRFEHVLARHNRISHLTYVLSFNRRDTNAGLELARLAEEDGRYAQAQTFFEQLVRQAPGDPRTRRALSEFYRRMGWPDRARLALQPPFLP